MQEEVSDVYSYCRYGVLKRWKGEVPLQTVDARLRARGNLGLEGTDYLNADVP